MPETQSIVLFDGVCNLCNASINFIIDHEPQSKLRFASLQSEFGQQKLAEHQLSQSDWDSMVLVEHNQAYTKSDAACRVAGYLRFPWSLGRLFLWIPRFLRNPIYELIARNRYRWFGKQDQCRLPNPELRSRFLD